MHVAVCIVTFRNVEDVVVCLKALSRSTHTDFEVVICENGGPEAFERLAAAIPAKLAGGQAVRAVLSDGNVGYAGGVNRGLRETPDADAWWVLNPDTAPQDDALQRLVERLGVGDCDLVGGTVYASDGRVELRAGGWRPLMGRAFSIGQGDPARWHRSMWRPSSARRPMSAAPACSSAGAFSRRRATCARTSSSTARR